MRILFAVALLLPVAAYADPPPVAKSISWFKAHRSETMATLSVCHDNSQFSNTATCVNAEAAATGLRAQRGPDLVGMMMDPRYWTANPVARDGLLSLCRQGKAMEPMLCRPAAQSAMAEIQQALPR